MAISTLLSALAVVSVAFEAPVAAAVFGAAAFCRIGPGVQGAPRAPAENLWLPYRSPGPAGTTHPPRFQTARLKGAAATKVHTAACAPQRTRWHTGLIRAAPLSEGLQSAP
jgi:hypothetical protein